MAELQKSGVALVVTGGAQANRELKAFQSALGKQNAAVKAAANTSASMSKVFGAVQKDLSGIASRALSAVPGISKFSGVLTEMTAASGLAVPALGALTAALGLAAVGFGAFIALGKRGAELQNQMQSFGNMVSKFQDSTVALEGLRKATRGTVTDSELMRLSVAALQGQSDEFRSVMLKVENGQTNLGKVFDITARAARASGQSVEIVREKFLTGLRLQSKLRLDDIGVTVIAEEANKRYAESLGKTAAALTDAEKKQAFLNEALRQLDKIGAEAPINSLQDAMARIGVVFTNIKDRLALAVQPLFEPFMAAVSVVINAIDKLASFVIPVIAQVFKHIGAIVTELQKTVGTIFSVLFGGMVSDAGTTAAYVIAAFQLISDGIIAAVRFVGSAVRAIFTTAVLFARSVIKSVGKAFGDLFGSVGEDVNLNINQLVYNMGYGGAAVAGAFAGGLLRGGTFVLKAVTEIAQIVADFLMGFSPPKKGVLHNIDKGGENTAIAWAQGFTDGVVKSFGAVTQYVNNRLGAIAYFSRDQLTAALARLDFALRPFKESLALAKADMEAIAGFTDPAMRIMERQRTALLKAFGRGEIADVDDLRAQDRQIQKLKELKAFGQDQVDQAELQLSLAQSQQAQQRALLQIALDRLGAEEKIASSSEAAAKAASEAAAKAASGGGGAGASGEAGLGGGFSAGDIPDLLSNDAIDAARQKIIAAIGGVVASGASGFSAGLADSGFGGALGAFNAQRGALAEQMGRIGDADPAQAIADKFAGLKEKITAPLSEVKLFFDEQFKAMFGEEGTITGYINRFGEKFLGLFTGDESPITLAKNALAATLMKMGEDFMWLRDQVDEKLSSVRTFIEGVFINEDSVLAKAFEGVTTLIDRIVGDEGFMRLVNDGAGTLMSALTGLSDTLWAALVMPIHGALQGMVNMVTRGFTNLINKVGGFLGTFGISLPEVGDVVIDIPQKAKGTLGINSPFIAGERGAELVTPQRNNPLSVFPNRATMALDRIGALMARPQVQAMPQYVQPPASVQNSTQNTTAMNSYNRSTVNNFKYKPTALELARMEMGG